MDELGTSSSINEEEELDPRVKIQLEHLNTCTDEINHLENQLDEANGAFRTTLSDSCQKLKLLAKKLGKCVEVARPYFDAKDIARKAQLECQRAAVQYQRACGVHLAARETISIAEAKFIKHQKEWEFDTAWQEMVNHATMKVMEAEAQKIESEREHRLRTQAYSEAEHKVLILERQLKKDISKARPYFEQKNVFQHMLQDLKVRVEALQKAVTDAKRSYSDSLRSLENISEEIHDRRKLLQPREPGVGAELNGSFDIDNFHTEDDQEMGITDKEKDSQNTLFAEPVMSELQPNFLETSTGLLSSTTRLNHDALPLSPSRILNVISSNKPSTSTTTQVASPHSTTQYVDTEGFSSSSFVEVDLNVD